MEVFAVKIMKFITFVFLKQYFFLVEEEINNKKSSKL